MSEFTLLPLLNDDRNKKEDLESSKLTWQENRKHLASAFGGRKTRVNVRKHEANQVV